jgi:hypothetical protein
MIKNIHDIQELAFAEVYQAHPHLTNPFYPEFAVSEAAKSLRLAMKGGRKANHDVTAALQAAFTLCLRFEVLAGRKGLRLRSFDYLPVPTRVEDHYFTTLLSRAARDARRISVLTNFNTGAIFFPEKRREALKLLRGLLPQLESLRIAYVMRPEVVSVRRSNVVDLIAWRTAKLGQAVSVDGVAQQV